MVWPKSHLRPYVSFQTTLGTEICGNVAQTASLQGCHVAGDYSVGLPDSTESLPAEWSAVPPALNAELPGLLFRPKQGHSNISLEIVRQQKIASCMGEVLTGTSALL